ncbi:MAG: methionine ABC transporter permease [Bacilli bacterium]
MKTIIENINFESLLTATSETLYMTLITTFATFVLGTALGVILFTTSTGQIFENKPIHFVLSSFVNIFRSIPFIIMIVLLLNVTNVLMGTIIGPNGALPALIIGSAPFYARMVELAMREIPRGVLEASEAMGASKWTIITRVLIPESFPALISGITVTCISIIGYTAMAGAIGSGGLGDLAWTEGYQGNNQVMVYAATLVILLLVYIIQFIGDFITKRMDKR